MTEHEPSQTHRGDPSQGEDPFARDVEHRVDRDDVVAPVGSDRGEEDASRATGDDGRHRAPNMLPGRAGRATGLERGLVRIIATGGVIGIGVAIAAILAANHVQGWIIGLVVATLSVVLSAVLWSSRQL